MYRLRILDEAIKELEDLDKPVALRLVKRINWLAENPEQIKPEPLTSNLAGFYKLRVGDYRVLYEVIEDERVIVIHQIGHRREIYRSR